METTTTTKVKPEMMFRDKKKAKAENWVGAAREGGGGGKEETFHGKVSKDLSPTIFRLSREGHEQVFPGIQTRGGGGVDEEAEETEGRSG